MDIEEILRRAQSEGRFRELPGKGKPLNLSKRPPQDLVGGIMKEAGFVPEWAQLGKEIEAGQESTLQLNARWLCRKECLLNEAADLLRTGKESDARKTLLQMQGERDAVARDLSVGWTRDRHRTERYNLLVPAAHQQRTVPSPAHLLRVFLERSPDVIVSPEEGKRLKEVPACLDVPAVLEQAERAVEEEKGEHPRMNSVRAEALAGFKQRYGGGRR